jgi:DNA-binding NarL/FixJ family response regulator
VGVVEGNDMERAYLVALLNGTAGLTCASAYGRNDKALSRLGRDNLDMIVVDLESQHSADIELLQQVRARSPNTPLLLLSPQLDTNSLLRVLEIGVSGLLVKPCTPDQIVRGIMTVHEGGGFISTAVAQRLFEYFHARGKCVAALTAREREVLHHLAEGLATGQIASHLGVSIGTLRTHLRNILYKMHVHSRSEAVAKYLNPVAGQPGLA